MNAAAACQIEKYFDKNYLERCQVATPDYIVQWVWSIINSKRRFKETNVLDLGCGDARFSKYGNFKEYLGVEIDRHHSIDPLIPDHVKIVNNCALMSDFDKYDMCIGNPPYVRHHDMDSEWQENIASHLSRDLGNKIDLRANAFLYFMFKGLISTHEKGLVAHIVPFEWVTRPSSEWLRKYIKNNKWSVNVYRLPEGIFSRVLTTSSLTIIDKSKKTGTWKYFNVNSELSITEMEQPSGTKNKVLKYTRRVENIYSQRGLSPGGQKIFCLTEEERLHNRLRIGADVVPCLSSMKSLCDNVKVLTEAAFKKYYINEGQRCWLIRSDKKLSSRLNTYLGSVDKELRDNWTCSNRSIWYEYKFPKISQLLFSSGFVKHGPQVIENKICAVGVGSISNIFINKNGACRYIANNLREYDFESRIVNQSRQLKKVEMNQMNTVLIYFFNKYLSTKL